MLIVKKSDSNKPANVYSSSNYKSLIQIDKYKDRLDKTKKSDRAELISALKKEFDSDFKKLGLKHRDYNDFITYMTKHVEKKDFLKAFHLYGAVYFKPIDTNKVIQTSKKTIETGEAECDDYVRLLYETALKVGIKGKFIIELTDPQNKQNKTDGHVEFFYLDEKSKHLVIMDQLNMTEFDLEKYDVKDWKEYLHKSSNRTDVICGKDIKVEDIKGEVSEFKFIDTNPDQCEYFRNNYK